MQNSIMNVTLYDLYKKCLGNSHYFPITDLMVGRGAGGVLDQIGEELNQLLLKGFVECAPFEEKKLFRITQAGKQYIKQLFQRNFLSEDKLLDLQEKIGEALYSFEDTIKDLCQDLTDDEIRELAFDYYQESGTTDSHNFPLPIFQVIADRIENQLIWRGVFRLADEYFKQPGATWYCVVCGGDCKGHE